MGETEGLGDATPVQERVGEAEGLKVSMLLEEAGAVALG